MAPFPQPRSSTRAPAAKAVSQVVDEALPRISLDPRHPLAEAIGKLVVPRPDDPLPLVERHGMSERKRRRHRDRGVAVLVAEALVHGAHPVVAALRPSHHLVDAGLLGPGELALLERLAEAAPAPGARDDREPVLGKALVVVRHQAGVADDLAVRERDERAFGQRRLVVEPLVERDRDRTLERQVGVALVTGKRVGGLEQFRTLRDRHDFDSVGERIERDLAVQAPHLLDLAVGLDEPEALRELPRAGVGHLAADPC